MRIATHFAPAGTAGLNNNPMQKSLDEKLARIAADASCKDFILADAKDADMAFGLSAPGVKRHLAEGRPRFHSIQDYRAQIRAIVEQRHVDIMLMSVSTSDQLTFGERLFETSAVTPAIRANDTTDIWLFGTQAAYGKHLSMPFRTAIVDEAIGANANGLIATGQPQLNLGLYSITLNNDVVADHATLSAYRMFREEAWRKGFRHFLEVFGPNAPVNPINDVPRFVNDSIVRLLAGAGVATRPLFLKIPYFGPAAMEELASYDSSLVVGILGGSAGTTLDAFQMLWEAKKYGARVALFGRKINNAEHQLSFVEQLRALADGNTTPAEAVKAYHGALQKRGIKPIRELVEDSQPGS